MSIQEDKRFPDVMKKGDDTELRKEIIERFRHCQTYYKDWHEAAQQDYKFALGDQWSQEDKQLLKEQNRPAFTFNRIRPLINLVSGYQRENSARIKVSPEGGEDKIFSEIMDKAIKAIDKWGKLSYKLGYLFDDGLYCGKGFLEAILEYDKDPIRGELKFLNNGPYKILVDPTCTEYDLNEGAEYCFKVGRFTKNQLMKMYPEHKNTIQDFTRDTDDYLENAVLQEGDADNYGNNPNSVSVVNESDDDSDVEKDAKFTLKEYWHKRYVKRYFVINIETSEPERFEKKEEAEDFAVQQVVMADQEEGPMEPMKVIERTVPEMHVAAMVCGHMLFDDLSPFEPRYNGFPFFRFLAYWAPNAEDETLKVQGVTRALVDPQKEKNKAKSQNLHILNTQASSGWIGDEDALTDTGWQALEKIGAMAGITVKKKKGSELREIQPKGLSQTHILREQQAENEFVHISGIHAELLGISDKNESGRAMAIRVKQGVTAMVGMFGNYRYTKEVIGKFILKMIPELLDVKKLAKIIGPKYMRSVMLPDNLDEQGQPVPGISEGHLQAYLAMVKDSKYDVEVTEADQGSTMRYEIFTQMMEMAKVGLPIPPSLLIDYMDISDSDEVKKQVQEYQQQTAAAAQTAKK